jgi:uncharacterized protein with gpF-like domain
MTFRASKKRERERPERVGKGTALIASSSIRIWYTRQMKLLAIEMIKDYRQTIQAAMQHSDVREYFAMDAATPSMLKIMMKLRKKWYDIWSGFAKKVSKMFVKRVDEHVSATVHSSLSKAGIKEPILTYNDNVKNTLDAAQDFNHTLITGISDVIHERIYAAVMLSLTSPDHERKGVAGIETALREIGGFTEKRIKQISKDQNSKLYSSLTIERMKQNKIDEFEWDHTGASKEPRRTHLDKDGKIFSINDPELWTGPKADQGPPGWAIGCTCRAIPIV